MASYVICKMSCLVCRPIIAHVNEKVSSGINFCWYDNRDVFGACVRVCVHIYVRARACTPYNRST